MKQLSSMMTGFGLQRLEHAADADAAGEMAVLADLRARADRRPGVDHRACVDIGAEIDEATASARRSARYRPSAARSQPGTARKPAFAKAVRRPSRRTWTAPCPTRSRRRERPAIGPHVVEAERQQHRLLQPLVDLPFAVAASRRRAPRRRRAGRARSRPRRAPRPWSRALTSLRVSRRRRRWSWRDRRDMEISRAEGVTFVGAARRYVKAARCLAGSPARSSVT